MENNNFNGEKVNKNNQSNKGFNGGIRNIDVPKHRTYARESQFKEISLEKKKISFIKKFILILILLAIVAGVLSYFFHSATFKVQDSVKDILFSNDIVKANNVNEKKGEEITFSLLEFDFTLEKDVKSKMVEDVLEKATGKIKIINNTTRVQKLRKETRFEVAGKIFKTYKSVTIPAKTSVVKDAFADEPGESYNLKKGLKMVVPGFKEAKDMDSYKKIVGEIAEDFTGGFVGKKDIPDKIDLEKKKNELMKEMESSIMVRARTKLPENFILNSDGIFKNVKYETKTKDDVLKVVGTAKVKAIIFDEKDFLSVVLGLEKEQVIEYNIDSTAFLKFKILNKNDISIDSLKSFNFELNGNLKYNRIFNKDEFVKLIKGKNDSEYKKLLEKNYNKDDFVVDKSIYPFWMSSIPNDETKIFVDILEE
ncbi:MAG TPA: hypothetical protein EYG89_04245 [Bacteroidia bacterium]|nr:hypothetical protein [Bacteroidia bacterium]